MTAYRLSRQADRDLDEIEEYISADNPQAAERVIAALYESFAFLARHPRSGRKRDDLIPGICVFPARKPADKYVIFYYDQENGIEISDVIHGARDWQGMFSRGDRGS